MRYNGNFFFYEVYFSNCKIKIDYKDGKFKFIVICNIEGCLLEDWNLNEDLFKDLYIKDIEKIVEK